MHGNRTRCGEQCHRCSGNRQSSVYLRIRAGPTLLCFFARQRRDLPSPVAITAVPDGKLHAPYFMEWSLGIERQLGTTGSLTMRSGATPFSTQLTKSTEDNRIDRPRGSSFRLPSIRSATEGLRQHEKRLPKKHCRVRPATILIPLISSLGSLETSSRRVPCAKDVPECGYLDRKPLGGR